MSRTIAAIDRLNSLVGSAVMWLALIMALVQFAVVIVRYVFAVGSIPAQESILYMHGILFTAGAGYALSRDAHVRVDVFYERARPRAKALVDLLGGLFLLLPVAAATLWLSFGYVVEAWRIGEGSREMSGLPLLFVLKTFIWVFAALVGLQGLALVLRAWLTLSGRSASYSAAGAG